MKNTLLASISIDTNSNIITVNSVEELSGILKNDVVHFNDALPVFVQSSDTQARTITLQTNYTGAELVAQPAVVVPTSADFRQSTAQVKSLTSLATQSINAWEALTNTVTTVDIDVAGVGIVQVDSIPKILQNAAAAGGELVTAAQNAVTIMGDAPALAQAVADNKALVVRYTNEAEDAEVEAGKYSMLHYLAKSTTALNSTAQLKADVEQLKADTTAQAAIATAAANSVNQFQVDIALTQVKNSNYTLKAGDKIIALATTQTLDLTLPSTLTANDFFEIKNSGGSSQSIRLVNVSFTINTPVKALSANDNIMIPQGARIRLHAINSTTLELI